MVEHIRGRRYDKTTIRIGTAGIVFFAALFWGAVSRAEPLPDEVRIFSPPAWLEAAVVDPQSVPQAAGASDGIEYLLIDRQVRVDGGVRTTYRRTLKRIANDAGLDSVSEVSIDFDPLYQTLDLHVIRVHRNGDVSDRLSADVVKVIQREEGLDYSVYDGSLSVLVFVEDLRVGDVVEVATTVRSENPVMNGLFFDSFGVQWSVPVHFWRYRLLWPKQRKLHRLNHATDIEPVERERGTFREYVWEQEEVPIQVTESDVPGWYDLYGWIQLGEMSSWREVVDWGTALFEPPQRLSEEIHTEIAAFESAAGEAERALAAIRFIQDEIRYLGFEMGDQSHRPTDPNIVFSRRFGDCKDKAFLLVAILKEMGFDADVAVVNSGAETAIDDWLPSPYCFNHAVVTFEVSGSRYWVDVTFSGQGGDLDHLYLPDYQRALVLNPTTTTLSRIPSRELTEPTMTVREIFTLEADGGAADFVVETTREGAAADDIRSEFLFNTREEVGRSYLNYYARTYPSVSQVAEVEFEDDREANTSVVREHYRVEEFWTVSDDETKRLVDLWAFTIDELLRKPVTAVRTAPLALDHPQNIRHTTEVRFQDDWNISPESQSIEGKGYHFGFESEYADRVLTLDYRLRTVKPWLEAEDSSAHIAEVEEISDSLGYSMWEPIAGASPAAEVKAGINWPIASTAGFYCLLLFYGWVKIFRFRPALETGEEPVGLPPALAGGFETEGEAAESEAVGESVGPESESLNGLRGWLILVGFGLVVTPIRMAVEIVSTLPTYSVSTWNALTAPSAERFDGLWAPVLIGELLGNLTLLAGSTLLVVLFFGRRRILPRAYIVFLVGSFLFLLADSSIADLLPGIDKEVLSEQYAEAGKTFLRVLIWVPYFLVSKRVKATFIR